MHRSMSGLAVTSLVGGARQRCPGQSKHSYISVTPEMIVCHRAGLADGVARF